LYDIDNVKINVHNDFNDRLFPCSGLGAFLTSPHHRRMLIVYRLDIIDGPVCARDDFFVYKTNIIIIVRLGVFLGLDFIRLIGLRQQTRTTCFVSRGFYEQKQY